MEKLFVLLGLAFLVMPSSVECNEIAFVNFECSQGNEIYILNILQCYIPSSLNVEKSNTVFRTIEDSKSNQTETESPDIDQLIIKTAIFNMKFMPAGIKRKFPKLKKISILSSGLAHVEREDMRQFGDDLVHISFYNNSLTAVIGNVFEFNTNLLVISFKKNPLKFIDAKIFQSFISMRSLLNVDFTLCGCMSQASPKPQILSKLDFWKNEDCHSQNAKKKTSLIMNERCEFFENESQLWIYYLEFDSKCDDLNKKKIKTSPTRFV